MSWKIVLLRHFTWYEQNKTFGIKYFYIKKNFLVWISFLFFHSLFFLSSLCSTESLSSFKLARNHNLIISFLSFYCLFKQMKKRKSKYSSLQQMTPAGVFRGSLAAGELSCSLVICCRTTLPEALTVLAGFGSWDLTGFKFLCHVLL